MKRIKTFESFKGTGPKGKDLSTFVRFGGLDLKTQKGYKKKESTFHAPPASRGFYAMPKVAQEYFLVGSLDKTQPGIYKKVPEYPEHKEIDGKLSKEDLEKWEKERDEFDWDKSNDEKEKRFSEIRKEFRKTEGNIWHHLGDFVKNSEVISRKGSWVKTSVKEWQRAFNKMSLKYRMPNTKKEFGADSGFEGGNINNVRGITGWYSKDHCEVFFDEKV